jgi:hypothetical protein
MAESIYKALSAVQQELKVPKGQKNTFGGYSYRSAEDILEAAKPVLAKHDLTLIVSDVLEAIGDRYYIKATATVHLGTESVSATGYAREEETKKGMDGSQITGAASSYARKYALNGLLNIDDTKDADTDEHRKVQDSAPSPRPASSEPADDVLKRAKAKINETLEQQGYVTVPGKKAFILKVLKKSSIESLDDADAVMDQLENEKGGE